VYERVGHAEGLSISHVKIVTWGIDRSSVKGKGSLEEDGKMLRNLSTSPDKRVLSHCMRGDETVERARAVIEEGQWGDKHVLHYSKKKSLNEIPRKQKHNKR